MASQLTGFFRESSHTGDLKAFISDNVKVEAFISCAVDITAHYRVMIQRIHPGTSHAQMEKISLSLIQKGRLSGSENHCSGTLKSLLQKVMIIEWNPALHYSPERNQGMKGKKSNIH